MGCPAVTGHPKTSELEQAGRNKALFSKKFTNVSRVFIGIPQVNLVNNILDYTGCPAVTARVNKIVLFSKKIHQYF